MMCGAPGFATGDGHLCATHGGVPSAAVVAEMVAVPSAVGRPLRRTGPASRPSQLWQAFTWLFVGLTAAHALILMVNIWALLREDAVIERFAADPKSVQSPAALAVFDLVEGIAGLLSTGLWVYLIVFVLWFATVGRVATRLGHDRRLVLRHWTYLVWRVSIVPLLVFAVIAGRQAVPGAEDRVAFRDAVLGINHTAIAFSIGRIATLGLLVAFTVIVWRRLSRAEAEEEALF
jgi:hypothetical protein